MLEVIVRSCLDSVIVADLRKVDTFVAITSTDMRVGQVVVHEVFESIVGPAAVMLG